MKKFAGIVITSLIFAGIVFGPGISHGQDCRPSDRFTQGLSPYDASPPKLYDRQGNYRGELSSNPFRLDSISNKFGRYGSPFSVDSINNPYGAGSRYKHDSPNNPYGPGWVIIDD